MPGTIFEVVANPLHHHGGLHIIHLKEITDDADDEDDDDDGKQESIGSATANASVTVSVAEKVSKMSLGK
jgi:hypothetical protein